MRDAIAPLLDRARREHAAARQLAAGIQASAWALRESARELQTALKQLRRVLRAQVGTRHVDYQRLRASRVRAAAAEVEADAGGEGDGVEPESAAA